LTKISNGGDFRLVDFDYIKTIPSYLSGSFYQTLATLYPEAKFELNSSTPVVMIPGAFCTSSVMNQLGKEVERLGHSIVLAPNFPYFVSALANTCRLDQAVDNFIVWLDKFSKEKNINEVDIVGHSNGGLIAMLAEERLRRTPDNPGNRIKIRKLVTMATPHQGWEAAKALSVVLPCCKDLIPGAEALNRAAKTRDIVVRCLVSEKDTLFPIDSQYFNENEYTVMEGFQHMDYIVGAPEKIAGTAHEVVRWLHKDS
jgi:triacylglycerol esterase/lipase EstA (alpha/beta hydrolase family)